MGKMRLYGGLGISSIQNGNRFKPGTRSPIANLTKKQCAFFAHRFSGKDVFVAYSHGGMHIANALSEDLAESPVVANLATTQSQRTPTVAKSEIVATCSNSVVAGEIRRIKKEAFGAGRR